MGNPFINVEDGGPCWTCESFEGWAVDNFDRTCVRCRKADWFLNFRTGCRRYQRAPGTDDEEPAIPGVPRA